MLFLRALAQNEMQTAFSRFSTRVTHSISYDNISYIKSYICYISFWDFIEIGILSLMTFFFFFFFFFLNFVCKK